MPCPFAPLLGLIPTLLAIPCLTAAWLRKKRRALSPKFDAKQIAIARQHELTLSANGILEITLGDNTLESFEFFDSKVPHFREKVAKYRGNIGNSAFLLFREDVSKTTARHAADVLSNAGIGFARVKNSILRMKVRDPEHFWTYGVNRFTDQIRAL